MDARGSGLGAHIAVPPAPVYRWPCSLHQLCGDSSSSRWLQGDSSLPVLVTGGLARL